MPIKPSIAVIDDDETIRDATVGLRRSLGFIAKAFSSAEDFLNSSSVKNSQVVDLESGNGMLLRSSLPGIGSFEGDSLQT